MRRLFMYCVCFVLLVWVAPVSGRTRQGTPPNAASNPSMVFVVRHAEAYLNLSDHAGMPEEELDSLTPRGIKQATETGAYLRDKNVLLVVASPTGRTRQTARIIAEQTGLKSSPSEDPAFASTKDGLTPDGKLADWSWRQEQWKAGRDPRPEGGESLEDAVKRAVQALEELIRQHPGKALVIVTHSDICAGLAGQAAGTPFPCRYGKHKTSFGSVIQIAVSPDGTWELL